MLLWSTLIYAPLCHWVWGGGWIGTKIGALDFAGGTVVHISSGVSALVTALYLGKRFGHGHEPMPPHNLPFTVIGAVAAVGRLVRLQRRQRRGLPTSWPATAFVNTNTAAAAAALRLAVGRVDHGRQADHAGRGLRARWPAWSAITPAAGFVTPLAAIFIGAARRRGLLLRPSRSSRGSATTTPSTWSACTWSAGRSGALLTGVFATEAVNSAIPR